MNLPVIGGHLCLQADIPAGVCDLASLVPAACTIASRLSMMTVSILRQNSVHVPCRKGCSSCCHYLVPVTVPEAIALDRAIHRLDTASRDALRDRLAAWSVTANLPTSCHPELDEPGTFARLARRYARIATPCPMLHAGLCTLYDARPIACREHSVIGSAGRCQHARGGTPAPVITSVFEALGRLHAELTGEPLEVVPMPSIHDWWRQRRSCSNPTGDGETLIRRLGAILADQFNTFVASRQAG